MEQEKASPFSQEGMFKGAHPLIFQRAGELRKNMTDAEAILWGYLRQGIKGCKVRRQHPIGIYIADFYCHKVKLIIELDGGIHDKTEVKENDKKREEELISWGNCILRFSNEEVMHSCEKVIAAITLKIEELLNKL